MIRKILITFLAILFSVNLSASQDMKQKTNWNKRKNDWRNGAIVYQIFVDRFAPSKNLKSKKILYQSPKILKTWNQTPKKGKYVKSAKVWSHEIEFWGGDLQGIIDNINYIKDFGADVVYLNPIFKAFTNHKYDTMDYMEVDHMFGTNDDLKELSESLHKNNMKLVLDGVFNHMSVRSDMFQDALKNKKSKWRNYFKFTDRNKIGYVGWWNVENLPELNYESKQVRDFIFAKKNSIVQTYLIKYDIDGWRLDVAYDLGLDVLDKITKSAHKAKTGSLVIGEIWNYPNYWNNSIDGISNMHARQIIFDLIDKKTTPANAIQMIENMIDDAGMDYILKCWLMLDNHDTDRLSNIIKDKTKQKMARFLQLTLPGSAYLYYGSELGMTGGEDPEQRAPMKWEMVNDKNKMLSFHKKIIKIRKKMPALIYGDFVSMGSKNLFAFMRITDKIKDSVVVIVNPTNKVVKESLQIRDGRVHSWTFFKDQLSEREFKVFSGMMDVELKPYDMMILKIDISSTKDGYNRYNEVK